MLLLFIITIMTKNGDKHNDVTYYDLLTMNNKQINPKEDFYN